ncbi:phage tail tape measure C-terminal domain-containing protein [Oceanicella actignis]|uniref:phage tail tape measure C-terminal domain-containing protein n=1 Tax=Oceanicella actignis TaxID=1189325 RepID=UPI00125A434E|nr:phage tail tape measure C-terminal domain-containing protein [Oceanicella actignis]TYO91426.1 lambda family phage tail tape measure protein [Oceanicella actignis]
MSEMRVGLRVDADTAKARKEIDETAKSVERMGDKARASGKKAAEGGRETQGAMTLAAGSVANLTAQFNDIGQMLVAGQSPLLLAIQQGTQITQVLGPMGARGAVQALGQAFLSMLSPLNLVTLGSIAAGAALVQWLTSASDEARSLADEIDDLSRSVRDFEKLRELSLSPLAELRIDFGDSAAQVRELYAALADLALLDATNKIADAAEAMRDELGDLTGYVRQLQSLDNALRLGEHPDDQARVRRRILANLREDFGLTEQEARALAEALDQLGAAAGPEDVAAAVSEINDAFDGVLARAKDLPAATREAARAAKEMAVETVKIKVATDGHARSAEKARQEAEALLAALGDEAAIRAAIKAFGEDSVEVERLRVEQARAAFAARVDEMRISEDLKQALMEAWDAARGIADEDIAGGLAAAADQAAALASQMERASRAAENAAAAAASAAKESELRRQYKDDPVALAGELAALRFKARVGDYSGFDPILRSEIDKRLAETVAAAQAEARNRQALAAESRTRARRPGGRAQDDTDRARAAFERLRASVDDAYAAQKRYADAERVANEAVKNGIVSKEAAADVLARVRQAIDDATRAAQENSATGWQAVTDALDAYAQKASDVGGQIGDAIVGAFNSAENAVANFVRTGKLDFRSLASSIIADLSRIALRKILLERVAKALGSAFGGGTSASIFHAGGVVGGAAPSRTVPAMVFAGAPRMHGGGWAGLRSDEVPAILQRGELVLSRREARAYAAGGGGVNVTIMARDVESFRQSRAQVAADIARAVSLGRRGL